MSSLAHLFAEESTARAGGEPAPRAGSSERVGALFAGPRTSALASAPAAVDDTPALQALVGGRGQAIPAAAGAVSGPTRIRRVGGSVDILNVVTAVLSVAALVTAVVVGWISITSASPERDALATLTSSEAVLANETRAVNAGLVRIDEARAAGIAVAKGLRGPLAATAGMVDEDALADVERAVVEHRVALDALVLPAPLEDYATPPFEQDSLASIGAAIDAVSERATEVSKAAADVRAVRDDLDALERSFRAAMAEFAAGVPDRAAVIVEENPDAAEELREAVTAAGSAVAGADLAEAGAAASLTAYTDAVLALRADQARFELELAQRLAWEEELRRQQEQQYSGGTDPAPPADSVEPTDPVAPSDPTDPSEPTDPVIPLPSPGPDGG